MQAYKKLEERFEKIMTLRQIDSVLDWDKAVLMPEKGVNQRAKQIETLGVMIHEMATDPQLGDWMAGVNTQSLSEWERANLDIMQWQYTHATALPADLVSRKMGQETKTEVIWRKARAESDFKIVQDDLARLLDIVREQAEVKAAKLKKPLYDALMDPYAPHMTSKDVDVIFDDIAAFVPGFLDQVLEKQKEPLPLNGPFAQDIQEKLGKQLCEALGFESSWGRLDTSTHPFSTGIGDDVRITTRYNTDSFINALQAVAHEAGHGFYDRFTPREWQHQPVGASQNMGMAIHESQSLSLDMQLARSREYWQWFAPIIQKAFNGKGPEWDAENVYRHAIKVERGFIRVEADEVTYPAHVIMRYRLEKAMVEGTLQVKDLPEAWNEGFKALLGVTPPDDRRGCLQDIHWYFGAFGYFPAYALGAFTAAQFVDTMKKQLPNVMQDAAKGNFKPFNGWLRDNVQSKGCLYKPQELVEKVTGQKMSTHFFKKHVTERYLEKAYEGSC
ncbi:MAG: Carboxypeptidase Taq [Alphaproteobacteria bacterium]|jgi:carboxypeptidase Taq|nr:Carboxypeptidase Taq [Alphaproteobacteria bacterium]